MFLTASSRTFSIKPWAPASMLRMTLLPGTVGCGTPMVPTWLPLRSSAMRRTPSVPRSDDSYCCSMPLAPTRASRAVAPGVDLLLVDLAEVADQVGRDAAAAGVWYCRTLCTDAVTPG